MRQDDVGATGRLRVLVMSTWLWSGKVALLFGSVAFALLFLPTVAYQYRRWGDWNLKRLAGTFLLSLYGVALVTYTWLPLPPRNTVWCQAHAVHGQPTPFRMVGDIARALSRETTVAGVLTNLTLLQVVFNMLLFVPLGAVMRRYFHRGVLASTLVGLGTSILIEATQLTGLWGIYPCAYRVADVDDVIVNTTGALFGALVAPAVLWWMPRVTLLKASRLKARPVTVVRRWTGQLIDIALLLVADTAITVGSKIVLLLLGRSVDPGAFQIYDAVVATLLPWLVIFVIPPWRYLAASPGQTAVWLTPIWRDAAGRVTHGTLLQRLVRANITAGPFVACSLVDGIWGLAAPMGALWLVPAVLSMVLVPFTATKRSLSGVLTGAEFVDIRSLPDASAVADPRSPATVAVV